MLGGLVGHDSCCCSSVSEPSLMALLWRVLMCGGGWFGLSSSFLGRQYATLGPEALCWEGLLGIDSCCCSSVSEPVLTAVFCNGLMWHKLCFLRASVRNVRP